MTDKHSDADETQRTSVPVIEALSPEAAILLARKERSVNVRARGEDPFANDVGAYERVGDVLARYADAKVEGGKYDATKVQQVGGTARITGRIVSVRSFGKASFLRLRDATGEIQLFCRKDALGKDYDRLHVAGGEIEAADHVIAEGGLMVTKTGELSLECKSLRLLTKAHRGLPEKWHGLQDVELRYRQRYVDLIANTEVADVFRARALAVRALRRFLDDQGFLEVDTPSLVTLVGGATARPFTTHHNALDLDLFLRIAPELFLKRCLVGGFDRVYEIARCYRNEGISTRHNPEFSMLEYYRAYATYADLMDQTEKMLRFVDHALAVAMPDAYARWTKDRLFTLDRPFARVPMQRAALDAARATRIPEIVVACDGGWRTVVDFLDKALRDTPERIKEWSKVQARAIDWGNLRKGLAKCENAGERLFAVYEYLAEPFLTLDYRTGPVDDPTSRSVPVFVIDHPFEISPLARRKDDDPSLTDRFELFIEGRELCNAFSELNDPDDQAARFQEQVDKKARGADETMDYDADYIRALEHGMPPAAGFGMGIDRLVMMLCSQPSIRDVILFPLLRPED
ncbi:MAG: lysine--tRNA ligase [Deltaproteobacteria bacterium]|nr:lysine--tRNA ligase [Deltaproteobacteria bacterium]